MIDMDEYPTNPTEGAAGPPSGVSLGDDSGSQVEPAGASAETSLDVQYQLVGESDSVRRITQLANKIADSELSVLIRGESGTGKEVVARMVHSLSSRQSGPFVKVNCAALSESLLESELFGHEKGAFTGAYKSRPGRFELAHRGTIFLDEIGDMAYSLQAKSLQVLEQKEFMPVGSTRTVRVDVRVISATNGILEDSIETKAFRRDLLYRLNDVTITMPPLRERKEDIPLLVDHFIAIYAQKYKREPVDISPQQMEALLEHDWPGNVRELESLIKRVIVLGDKSIVESAVFGQLGKGGSAAAPAAPTTQDGSEDRLRASGFENGFRVVSRPDSAAGTAGQDEIIPLKEATARAIRETEVRLLNRTLARTRWNRREAAKILKISYRSLLYKIKKYRLLEPRPPEF
jgi:transcriptional regulator with PAS, ATPase and Fis domain